MAATQYGSLTNQVQTVSNKNNDKNNKMNKLMDLLCQIMATQASTSAGDQKPPPAMNHALGKATMCSNCNKPGHSIINCWEKGGGQEGMKPDMATVKCKHCGEMGHFTSQ